jgi:3-deoxy-D-manno-octulosonic-acid transferase
VSERAIEVLGNLKFDLPASNADAAELRARYGLAHDRPIVAAGSTGDGEDRLVLDAFSAARRAVPNLLLLLAPRHPDRFEAAADQAARRGFTVSRVSQGAAGASVDVLLVDTIGQLAAFYALAGSAFVGGSLVPVGGHNLLEPLAVGVPVLFGPHTQHVADMADNVERSGAGIRVENADALGRAFAELATHPDERARRAASGRAFLAANRGALGRAVDLVLSVLDRPRPERPS